MQVKRKTIFSQGKPFIKRLSVYLQDKSSFKLHLILNDDLDEPHTHPWDFTSLILFGGYTEESNGQKKKYGFLRKNVKLHHASHKITLFRVLGFKIPTITIGKYSKKLQLCSFCQQLGYCKMQKNGKQNS